MDTENKMLMLIFTLMSCMCLTAGLRTTQEARVQHVRMYQMPGGSLAQGIFQWYGTTFEEFRERGIAE